MTFCNFAEICIFNIEQITVLMQDEFFNKTDLGAFFINKINERRKKDTCGNYARRY